MRAAVARIIGDGHSEAVRPVKVRGWAVAPQARRRIDACGPVRGRPRHGKHHAVAQALDIGRGQGPRQGRIFVARPACAPRYHRGIIHRRHCNRHGIGVGQWCPRTVGRYHGQGVAPVEVQRPLISKRR